MRRPHLSVRALMILVVVVGAGLGLRERARRRAEAYSDLAAGYRSWANYYGWQIRGATSFGVGQESLPEFWACKRRYQEAADAYEAASRSLWRAPPAEPPAAPWSSDIPLTLQCPADDTTSGLP